MSIIINCSGVLVPQMSCNKPHVRIPIITPVCLGMDETTNLSRQSRRCLATIKVDLDKVTNKLLSKRNYRFVCCHCYMEYMLVVYCYRSSKPVGVTV